MLRKQNSRKNAPQYYCPKCDRRLWHIGSPKYLICHKGVLVIQQYVRIPRQSALLLATRGVYVNRHSWIEEFMCGEHGKLWMKVDKKADGSVYTLSATSKDWQ